MSAGPRLFVALDPPAAVRTALADWAYTAVGSDPALRLIGPQALHLTLAFLGERPEHEVDACAAVLVAAAAAPAAALALGDVLWLAPRRPHVLTVALTDASGWLAGVHAALGHGLAEAVGFAPDRRPFRPHLTAARVRRGQRPRSLELPPPPALSFAPEALTLYRSRLGGPAARYEPLARVELRADAQAPRAEA